MKLEPGHIYEIRTRRVARYTSLSKQWYIGIYMGPSNDAPGPEYPSFNTHTFELLAGSTEYGASLISESRGFLQEKMVKEIPIDHLPLYINAPVLYPRFNTLLTSS